MMIWTYMRILFRSLCPAQWIYLLGGAFLALLILTGCAGAGDEVALTELWTPPAATATSTSVNTAVSQPLPAVAVVTVLAPSAYPADTADASASYPANGQLPSPVVVAQAVPNQNGPPPTPTAVATSTPSPSTTPDPSLAIETELETETAITPEAQPVAAVNGAGNGEHFWLRRPVPQGSVVWTNKHYPYGGTRSGTLRPHHGVEFDVPYNTPIYAAADGTIVFAGRDDTTLMGPEANFYGQVVVIEHTFLYEGQAVYTLYAHLQEVFVAAGQPVNMDEPLGLSGATGVADGPHLHFEVRVGVNSYAHTRNPVLWLAPFPDRGIIVGRVTDVNGNLLPEAPVVVRPIGDNVSGFSASTASYADNSVNGDNRWQENFAVDDVPAGSYEVEVRDGNKRYKAELFVLPNQAAVVEIVVGER